MFLAPRVFVAWCMLLTGACGQSQDTTGGFVIGLPLPYTGDAANSGTTVERAVYLAVEQINAAGGVNGTKVSVRTYDTHSAPRDGYKVVSEGIADAPTVIIAPDTSALVAALQPAASQAGVLVVTPGETYPVQGEPFPPSQDIWVQLNPVIEPMAKELATSLIAAKKAKVAFCFVNDLYGQDYLRAFSRAFLGSGSDINAYAFQPNQPVTQDSISNLVAYGADAVVLFTPPAVAAELVNGLYLQAGNSGVALPTFYFGPTLQSTVFTHSVIAQALGDGFGVAPATSDPANAFPEQFATRWYGDTPSNAAFYYYDAVWYVALHAQAAAKDLGTTPGPEDILNKMKTAGADPDAGQILWSNAGIFLSGLEAQQTFVYLGVTGPITLGTNGIRTLTTPYLVNKWTP